MIGTVILSSMGLYASVNVPTNAPIIEGIMGSNVKALKNPTIRNAKLPSMLFNLLNGSLCFPNLLPTSVEAESPSKSINIPVLAMAILKLKMYSVAIIPMKKYKKPLSSSLLLHFDKIVERSGM